MAKPELKITFKGHNGEPLSGKCSVCNENIDRDHPTNKSETIEAAFKEHVKQKHRPEDPNHATHAALPQ